MADLAADIGSEEGVGEVAVVAAVERAEKRRRKRGILRDRRSAAAIGGVGDSVD